MDRIFFIFPEPIGSEDELSYYFKNRAENDVILMITIRVITTLSVIKLEAP